MKTQNRTVIIPAITLGVGIFIGLQIQKSIFEKTVGGRINAATEYVKDTGREAYEKASQRGHDFAERIKNKSHVAYDSAKQKSHDVAENVQDKSQAAYDKAKQKGHNVAEDLKQTGRDIKG